jgi:hypothetical protein
MPATEHALTAGTMGLERMSMPAAAIAGHAERRWPCARREICGSMLCQINRTNTDCPGSRKGN